MTQQPQLPMTAAQSLKFLESYMDCTENLPLEIQRFVTQIREYDILYRNELQQITNVMILYSQEKSEQERKKHLNNVQKYLIKSQHYADEKISLITQMLDIAETRNIQVYNDAKCINEDKKEEINNTVVSKSNNNTASNINSAQMKIEKPVKPPVAVEKPSKTTYDKPKRPRRSKAVEKVHDRVEKLRAQEEAEKEEETEEIDDEESRQPRNNHKKNNNKVVKVKEQAEEKKPEKKPATKVTKKTNRQNGKNKKRKKEQELSTEEMAVDPDEPTYCLCNSISYGDMIGCDNDECQIEWFHFGCVSLTHKPKGKWYCPNCTTERKNKK